MNPRKVGNLSLKEIDGQFLVLDRPRGRLHELNATAGYIWQHCDGQTSVAELAAAVTRTFDTDPETAEQDVATILKQFESCQLIEWEADSGQ